MDFSKTLDLIVRDLEEALEIIDDFRNYPDVPDIQVELAKAKCRNAAEVIAYLKKASFAKTAEAEKRLNNDERSLSSTATKSGERSESGEKIPRSGTEDGGLTIAERKLHKAEPKEEVDENTEIVHQAGILADTFGASPDSLNEKLGSLRADENVPDYLRGKPFTSLKEAIGINDRFLFIRELFAGNAESYSQAISKLDEAGSLSDAKALLTEYTPGKAECEAARQLLDLVKRKYRGNE